MNWNNLELPDNPYYQDDAVVIYNADCMEILPQLQSGLLQMILCDLPYGITRNKWDCPIPLKELWVEYERIICQNGMIALTSAEPFTSMLVTSNLKLFRYDLIWDKKLSSGFLNAKRMPLRRHENILCFYKALPAYNPQMTIRGKPRVKGINTKTGKHTSNYGAFESLSTRNNEYYPTSVIELANADRAKSIHPTQKPVDLFRWLINTYTNKDDTILDNCLGSGTTAVAAKSLNRHCIGIEIEEKYCEIAANRCCQTVMNFDALERRR